MNPQPIPSVERRVGAAMDVVLAVDNRHQRADPEEEGGDRESDHRAAPTGHLISEVIACALSSLLGMKPRAGLATIS